MLAHTNDGTAKRGVGGEGEGGLNIFLFFSLYPFCLDAAAERCAAAVFS